MRKRTEIWEDKAKITSRMDIAEFLELLGKAFKVAEMNMLRDLIEKVDSMENITQRWKL